MACKGDLLPGADLQDKAAGLAPCTHFDAARRHRADGLPVRRHAATILSFAHIEGMRGPVPQGNVLFCSRAGFLGGVSESLVEPDLGPM